MDESGAGYLASIFGTEKDKVNCSFFFKTGSCRHGDACSRAHNKPSASQTILIRNLYIPVLAAGEDPQEHYEDFYDDIFSEMAKHGKVVDMVVCENAGVHLAGNTYIKFEDEEQAAKAMAAVQGRFYAGRPLQAEFTPVTDFWEGICKQLEKENVCGRSLQCNFMHLKKIGPDLERDLYPNGRGQSRGYSGGAYGRTDRTGFEQRSSYDRGNFRQPEKRDWNDRRPYDRREQEGGGGGGDRPFDPHYHGQQHHHYRGPPHGGPPHGGPPHHDFRRGPPPPRYHDRPPNQHQYFDDHAAAAPPPPPQFYGDRPPNTHVYFDDAADPTFDPRGAPPPDFYAEPPRHRTRSRSPVRHN